MASTVDISPVSALSHEVLSHEASSNQKPASGWVRSSRCEVSRISAAMKHPAAHSTLSLHTVPQVEPEVAADAEPGVLDAMEPVSSGASAQMALGATRRV